MTQPEHPIIFYSWQSDLPKKDHHYFIASALNEAIRAIHTDASILVRPTLTSDTQGVAGAKRIDEVIFAKIKTAAVFVADVSFVNPGASGERLTPNPNVLIELGYALRHVEEDNLILVLNTATGRPEDLPFDLRGRRVLRYNFLPTTDRKSARHQLAEGLEGALRLIFHEQAQRCAQPAEDWQSPYGDRAIEYVRIPPGTIAHSVPPFLMCALTPATPAPPIVLNSKADSVFIDLCISLMGLPARQGLVRQDEGLYCDLSEFLLDPSPSAPPRVIPSASAYSDGSISFRKGLNYGGQRTPETPIWLSAVAVWRWLRRVLLSLQGWPRALGNYDGSLRCWVAIGNVDNTIFDVGDLLDEDLRRPPLLNRQPHWAKEIRWERNANINDVVQSLMESLARHLQFGYVDELFPQIRQAAEQDR